MAIMFKNEDIFSCDVDALVNPVSCIGSMGVGLASEFKERYPQMFNAYKYLSRNRAIHLGSMFVYNASKMKGRCNYIINFPINGYWMEQPRLEYIEWGMRDLISVLQKYKDISSVAIPMLGCRKGGLKWEDVRSVILKYIAEMPSGIDFVILEDLK